MSPLHGRWAAVTGDDSDGGKNKGIICYYVGLYEDDPDNRAPGRCGGAQEAEVRVEIFELSPLQAQSPSPMLNGLTTCTRLTTSEN